MHATKGLTSITTLHAVTVGLRGRPPPATPAAAPTALRRCSAALRHTAEATMRAADNTHTGTAIPFNSLFVSVSLSI
jgi:hypothetical protein